MKIHELNFTFKDKQGKRYTMVSLNRYHALIPFESIIAGLDSKGKHKMFYAKDVELIISKRI